MNHVARLAVAVAGLVAMLGSTPSWGGPPNPTASDANGNTAGGTGALENVVPSVPGKYQTPGALQQAFGDGRSREYHRWLQTTPPSASARSTANTTGTSNTASGP